ncbi:MAG: NAD-dependent epimerase/dehydratase family protein [Minwuia sp.]|uniref:NAD-dependent epimerase/dehydratase family protein n=1 Tax=Minwuia sp. TaxID=2493630 RepID=UPI003A86FCA7
MPKTVCVAGASGLVGSNIVKACLARGYRVHGTMRDSADPAKHPYLMALPGAAERLTLFDADMSRPGDFDAPAFGCDAVFIACLIPTYAGPSGMKATEMDLQQGYDEIIMPTVNGCLNILQSAAKQGVGNAIICSSTSSTNPVPPVEYKNETEHWSDPDQQCAARKYTSATKAVMEKAALRFCAEHEMRPCILLPTLMLGPMIIPGHMDEGLMAVLSRLAKGEKGRHDKVPNGSTSMIHVDDIAALFLAAYENPAARGRYFGVKESRHWQDIYTELQRLMPDMVMPEPLDEEPEPPTTFDFTRRDSLGVDIRPVPEILESAVAFAKNPVFGA